MQGPYNVEIYAKKPKDIANMLKTKFPKLPDLTFRLFLGINNIKSDGSDGNYCPIISFFQLLVHQTNILQYMNKTKSELTGEILFKEVLTKLNKTKSPNAINIYSFTKKWDFWGGNTTIPEEPFDASEFIEYFFNSCSKQFRDFFTFSDGHYLLYLTPSRDSLQNLINNSIDNDQTNVSNICIITVLRQNQFYFNYNQIDINSFINIKNTTFKFFGAITFTNGHYHTIIKICDHYFLFDDELVCPLFKYNNQPAQLDDFINVINQELHCNTAILLYEKFEGNADFDAFETIPSNQLSTNFTRNLSNGLNCLVFREPIKTNDPEKKMIYIILHIEIFS